MNPRSTAERATVYVIAAHNAVRDSLGLLFEAHAVPVRTYASGDAFLRDLPAVANGCLIVDVNWRSPKIAEFLRVLDARQVAMPAVILDDRVMVGMRGNRAG